MIKCKEFTKLVSLEEKPNWKQQLAIRFHLMICHHCSNFYKQINLLNLELKKIFSVKNKHLSPEQMQDLESKIIQQIPK
jgi:predicted anti-sigma-YlaC factor YlaD